MKGRKGQSEEEEGGGRDGGRERERTEVIRLI